ncbi:MAG: MmgE/PrpD family protein [Thermodesulfobacteriota bacterium]
MTIISDFARFAAGLSYESVPERVRQKIRLQVLTSLSAARFSAWHEGAARVLAAERGGEPVSTVIATGEKTGPEAAVAANAAYAMSLDFDDYMLMGHTGYSAVLTPLAFLEAQGGTVGDFITAAAAVNEVIGRLSFACFFGPLNGQMWSYIHNLGAATAVGKVKGFPEETLADAMALSLVQPNFCLAPGFWHEDAKALTATIPLKAGMAAARYAEAGLSGPKDVVEGPLGFFRFFSFAPVPEFCGDLQSSWLSDTLSYKRYPGTSYIGASVDSAREAAERAGRLPVESPDEVEEIVVDTTFLSHGLEAIAAQRPPEGPDAIAVNFSVRLSVAYALLAGDLLPESFRPERLAAAWPGILALAEKVRVRHDWEMTARTMAAFPQAREVLASLGLSAAAKIADHARAVQGSAAKGRASADAVFQAVTRLLGRQGIAALLSRMKTRPRGLSAMDLAAFPMLQSARTSIVFKNGRSVRAHVDIPTGGSGQDTGLRREWVKTRCLLAFGCDPEPAFRVLARPEAKVSELVAALRDA